MSINRVILMGKLISKKKNEKATKAVIQTSRLHKEQTFTENNFIVAFGATGERLFQIPENMDVMVEGRLSTSKHEDKYYTEVVVLSLDVPNEHLMG